MEALHLAGITNNFFLEIAYSVLALDNPKESVDTEHAFLKKVLPYYLVSQNSSPNIHLLWIFYAMLLDQMWIYFCSVSIHLFTISLSIKFASSENITFCVKVRSVLERSIMITQYSTRLSKLSSFNNSRLV